LFVLQTRAASKARAIAGNRSREIDRAAGASIDRDTSADGRPSGRGNNERRSRRVIRATMNACSVISELRGRNNPARKWNPGRGCRGLPGAEGAEGRKNRGLARGFINRELNEEWDLIRTNICNSLIIRSRPPTGVKWSTNDGNDLANDLGKPRELRRLVEQSSERVFVIIIEMYAIIGG